MITKAKFTNFKLLRDVEIPLGRFNVIVGANGTGKSSALEGLHYLLQLARLKHDFDGHSYGRLGALFRGDSAVQKLASGPNGHAFQLSASGSEFVEFTVRAKESPVSEFPGEVRFEAPDTGPLALKRGGVDDASAFFGAVSRHRLPHVVRLRLDPTNLSEDHYSEDANPRVEYDGTGLASVLQLLLGARDGRFENIERDLAKIVPAVKRIRVTRAAIERREKIRITVGDQETWSEQLREYIGSRIEIEWGKVGWIPAAHLSEGTLLALGVITVLHHNPPQMILLDDIDKALHPTAQRQLVAFLKSVIQAQPELQILATTHSPYVVDDVAPEDILVCASNDERESKIRRLSDHPGWNRQKDYLRPGEFWSATGEAWVVDGKA